MTKRELQQELNDILSNNFSASVGTKFVTVKHFWAKGSNNPDRGNFNKSFKVKIEEVIEYLPLGQQGIEGLFGWYV